MMFTTLNASYPINVWNREFGRNALHTLAEADNLKNAEAIFKLLLEYGININQHNEKGYSPLYIAIERCNSEMIKLLLQQPTIYTSIEKPDDLNPGNSNHIKQINCLTKIIAELIQDQQKKDFNKE